MTVSPLLTPDDVKARTPGDALNGTDAAVIARYVDEFTGIAQDYTGKIYGSRTVTEAVTLEFSYGRFVTSDGRRDVGLHAFGQLANENPSAVSAVDSDNNSVQVRVDSTGVLTAWGIPNPQAGTDPVLTVTYTYGSTATPPEALLHACAEYVRACKVQASGSQPETAQSYSVDNYTYRQTTPDWEGGKPTGFRTVDKLLNSLRPRIPGLA